MLPDILPSQLSFRVVKLCFQQLSWLLQVYYEDLDNGDRSEAYCSLVHCYSLPAQGGLWVEHGYFDDR